MVIQLSATPLDAEAPAAGTARRGWPSSEIGLFDPRRAIATLRKRRGLIITVALATFVIAALLVLIAHAAPVPDAGRDPARDLLAAVAPANLRAVLASPEAQAQLAQGLLLAIALGLAAGLVATLLDATLTTASDVERRLRAPYLGGTPSLHSIAGKTTLSPADYVARKPLSSFSEAFRALRVAIQQSGAGEPVKVIALTSSVPGEGKTTTAACLARAAALQGQRVVLVDCDLRRRTVNQLLQSEPAHGLVEVLNGDVALQDAIATDAASGAHILPLASSASTTREIFGTAAMDRLLAELRGRYDLVLLDTAPVLPVCDTWLIAPKADAVVFLARWRRTPDHTLKAAFRVLAGTGARLAGVVLTQIDVRGQARYGYGDPGYYYAEGRRYHAKGR